MSRSHPSQRHIKTVCAGDLWQLAQGTQNRLRTYQQGRRDREDALASPPPGRACPSGFPLDHLWERRYFASTI